MFLRTMSAVRNSAGGANEMRKQVALLLGIAAASAILAILAHDYFYPTNLDGVEPALRVEFENNVLDAKREILLLLIGGLIAWISQGDKRD